MCCICEVLARPISVAPVSGSLKTNSLKANSLSRMACLNCERELSWSSGDEPRAEFRGLLAEGAAHKRRLQQHRHQRVNLFDAAAGRDPVEFSRSADRRGEHEPHGIAGFSFWVTVCIIST